MPTFTVAQVACYKLQQKYADTAQWCAFSPDGTLLLTIDNKINFGNSYGNEHRVDLDQTIKVWDTRTGQCLRWLYGAGVVLFTNSSYESLPTENIPGGISPITCYAFSPDSHLFALKTRSSEVSLWDLRTGSSITMLCGPKYDGDVTCCAFSPDGNLLAITTDRGTINLSNPRTIEQLPHNINHHGNPVLWCAFNLDGTLLATASNDHSIRLWNIHTGECLHTLVRHTARVICAAFSPDNSLLITVSADNIIHFWDPRTGDYLRTVSGSTGYATLYCAFTLNGSLLVTASNDHTLKFYDPSTGQCLHTLQAHHDAMFCCAFNVNGNTFSTASAVDRAIKIWELGQIILPDLNRRPETPPLFRLEIARLLAEITNLGTQNAALQQRNTTLETQSADRGVYVRCVVCMDRPPSYSLMPCNHFCLCQTCLPHYQQLNQSCPICRTQIQNIQRIFIA